MWESQAQPRFRLIALASTNVSDVGDAYEIVFTLGNLDREELRSPCEAGGQPKAGCRMDRYSDDLRSKLREVCQGHIPNLEILLS